MDGLRWILLFFGILLVVGVYVYSRRAPAKKPAQPAVTRQEPTLSGVRSPDLVHDGIGGMTKFDVESGDDFFDDTDSDSDDEDALDDEVDEVAVPVPQKIVTLRMIAHGGETFQGDELILNLRGIGMRHGKFGIFHHFDSEDSINAVFSAASLVEPGSFDLANIKDQQIPGISMFAVLPGPIDGVEAFDMLMAAARTLAQSLHGELLDESGSTLSIQRERYMREEIVQYQHSNKLV
jgi:cell division protein ZipA